VRAFLLALALVFLTVPGFAAEGTRQSYSVRIPVSPLQNPQAQAVAASRECWRSCQRVCATNLLTCGYRLPGSECLAATDACDRSCQRQCRFTGDPLLDFFE
jgi:hypothetical protein